MLSLFVLVGIRRYDLVAAYLVPWAGAVGSSAMLLRAGTRERLTVSHGSPRTRRSRDRAGSGLPAVAVAWDAKRGSMGVVARAGGPSRGHTDRRGSGKRIAEPRG